MNSSRYYPTFVLCFAFLVSLSGCASSPAPPPPKPPVVKTPGPGKMTRLEHYVWQGVRGWQGVPYKWGGNGADGIDCSAFAKHIYRKLFRIDIPRTTKDQVHIGNSVDDRYLRAGDLVFFRESANSRHVGIYLRNRMFIHASKSQGGVVVSHLDMPQWQKIYWQSRRVLPYRIFNSAPSRSPGA